MNQARLGFLVLAALIAAPSVAQAQKKKKAAPKPPAAAPADTGAAAGTPPPAAGAAGTTEIDADAPPGGAPAAGAAGTAAPAEGAPAPAADVPGSSEAGDLGDICKIDPTACPSVNLDQEAKRPLNEQMYAVQQIYALRYHRVEFQLAGTLTLNDQFVNHPGPEAAINYYVSNVLAIGISGGYYFNNDQKFNAETRRAARVAVPLTEYQWEAALNMTYVPMYGKFAGFGDFIFHYDAYIVGGVGAISTRPIPVIDPDNRSFSWGDPKVAFNIGIGLRIFINKWFAVNLLEVRDYVFFDKLENTTVAAGSAAADQKTWFGENKLTNNVQAQVGISIFVPFSWDYRLPK